MYSSKQTVINEYLTKHTTGRVEVHPVLSDLFYLLYYNGHATHLLFDGDSINYRSMQIYIDEQAKLIKIDLKDNNVINFAFDEIEEVKSWLLITIKRINK